VASNLLERAPSNIALVVLAVFLYGTLALAERRSGHIIMLLVGLFAAGMPVIHMRGAHYGEIARSAGGFFFVWTVWAGAHEVIGHVGVWTRNHPIVVGHAVDAQAAPSVSDGS
jgi:biotin transporter BioY